MNANMASSNYQWFSIFFFIMIICALVACIIKIFNLETKMKLLSVLAGKLSNDFLFEMIQKLPIKYFDDFLLNQISEYYNRNIISPESLRESMDNLEKSEIDDVHKRKIEWSLRRSITEKPVDALGEIYASCLISETCYEKPFEAEIKFLRDVIWQDILGIESRKKIYLSMKKSFTDFTSKTSDENHKKLMEPVILNIDGQIAQYS